MSVIQQAQLAKEASIRLAALPTEAKNKAIHAMADAIKKNKSRILKGNAKDVEEAKKSKLKDALIKRLILNEEKINAMMDELNDVAGLDDPVGKILSVMGLDKDLALYKVSCPIGVIGAIFESRPDAAPQISSLCLKSGNAVILKGGSEARNSNKILVETLSKAAENAGIPKGSIQLIETREEVREMLKMDKYIDLIIPRGSNKFVKYIQDNTRIAVLGHSEGICHVYIDKDADLEKAVGISLDAKCQYPAVCNAMETMLVHKDIGEKFLPIIIKKFLENNVELRLDNKSLSMLNKSMKSIMKSKNIKKATEKDWGTEYNDLILSIKIVNDADEAVNHINKYGSKHTDAIVTENKEAADKFMNFVDSSSVMWNASTRFADGYRYGKGAEVGISTAKIHARGPVGLGGLVIYKYKLIGNGHVVKDYIGKGARRFIHKKKFLPSEEIF